MYKYTEHTISIVSTFKKNRRILAKNMHMIVTSLIIVHSYMVPTGIRYYAGLTTEINFIKK